MKWRYISWIYVSLDSQHIFTGPVNSSILTMSHAHRTYQYVALCRQFVNYLFKLSTNWTVSVTFSTFNWKSEWSYISYSSEAYAVLNDSSCKSYMTRSSTFWPAYSQVQFPGHAIPQWIKVNWTFCKWQNLHKWRQRCKYGIDYGASSVINPGKLKITFFHL